MPTESEQTSSPQTPTGETKVQPDPVLKQPEKSHMHSKDAHPASDTSGVAKNPA